MKREFFYNVNGTEYYDTEAFGKAWKQAKEQATIEHCEITRTVVCGNKIRYEYYDKAGIFMDEKYRTIENIKIF